MNEAVTCHSGFRYDESPRFLRWQGQRLEVQRITAGWLTPAGRGFRVLAEDGQSYTLIHRQPEDDWLVQPV